ncbi:hypothetical protein [uncultured Chryseobacterium sp.]|uniref:hypothetical protein n=1 Tax=uncultured Chryseobacterium sp. TaxID=259322 RepID=UPI0025CC3F9A|nr:hypothetical protein [uncultured Chryseobacterium sp.]
MTYEEFYNNLGSNTGKRDLETYLLALLNLVEQAKEQTLSAGLLSNLLMDAFTSEPEKFNTEWLKIVEAPDEKAFINSKTNSLSRSEYDYTVAVIKFQIAELHKMNGKQLDDEYKYFGIDSETGNRWYNFDPDSILECGMRCYLDHSDHENNHHEFEVSWKTLGDLLEMGRIYE